MLELKEIKRFYDVSLHPNEQFLLKEYLQYKILEIIFSSKYASKLVFIGGSCLRIVHQNQRFSEDLDFDNFNLTTDDFNDLSRFIKNQLAFQGYEVEIKNVIKGAFHCHIRFPKLLMQSGLSGYAEEKILIQIDTEAQGFNFKADQYFLNKFDVLTSIFVAPLTLLLAHKFYAVLNRKRNKGRDFFDIVYLLSLNVKPDFAFLEQKQGIINESQLKSAILEHCLKLDMNDMANDVAPFLFNSIDVKKIQQFEAFLTNENL